MCSSKKSHLSMSATELLTKSALSSQEILSHHDSPMSESDVNFSAKKKSFVEKHKLITMLQHESSPMLESPVTETDTGMGSMDAMSGVSPAKPLRLDVLDRSIDTDLDVSEMSPMNNEEEETAGSGSPQATVIEDEVEKKETATSPI